MTEKQRREIALFRYSLIAPLINSTYTQATAKEYLEEITARKFDSPKGLKDEFAPATVKEWLRLYRKHGLDGLYPRSRSDKGRSRVLTKEAREFTLKRKLERPSRTAKSIYHELIARGYMAYDEVSLSTVQRFLINNRALIANTTKVDRRAFEFEYPNECWQSDISVGPYLTIDGRKRRTYIIAFIDDSSRIILHCEAFYADNLLSLLTTFKKAVTKRGIPKKLFVDNGKVYRSGQMQFICASLGTILCFAKPYSPESKGKIERWFRTMQDQWMSVIDWAEFTSLEHLNEHLHRYAESYNNTHHSSIGQKPIDKFMAYVDEIKFITSRQEISNIFLYRVTRRVKKDATISMNSIQFEVPQEYVGESINVRYDPTDLSKAFIFSEKGQYIGTIYPVKKIDNTKVRRDTQRVAVDFSPFSPVKEGEKNA